MKAIRGQELLIKVERDTCWTRDRLTYGPPPEMHGGGRVYVISKDAKIRLIEGREECGYGCMTGDIDIVRASGPGYARGALVGKASGTWSNYGAPSGTHTTVTIEWQFVADEIPAVEK